MGASRSSGGFQTERGTSYSTGHSRPEFRPRLDLTALPLATFAGPLFPRAPPNEALLSQAALTEAPPPAAARAVSGVFSGPPRPSDFFDRVRSSFRKCCFGRVEHALMCVRCRGLSSWLGIHATPEERDECRSGRCTACPYVSQRIDQISLLLTSDPDVLVRGADSLHSGTFSLSFFNIFRCNLPPTPPLFASLQAGKFLERMGPPEAPRFAAPGALPPASAAAAPSDAHQGAPLGSRVCRSAIVHLLRRGCAFLSPSL